MSTNQNANRISRAITARDMDTVAEFWANSSDLQEMKYILSFLVAKKLVSHQNVIRIMQDVLTVWMTRAKSVKLGKGPNLVDGIQEIQNWFSYCEAVTDDKIAKSATLVLSVLDTMPVTLYQWLRYRNSQADAEKFLTSITTLTVQSLKSSLTKDAILALAVPLSLPVPTNTVVKEETT